MRPRDILRHQLKQPFVPIRIHVSDGSSGDVRYPELFMVTTHAVFIAQPPEKDGVPERNIHCEPLQITSIEPINGQRSKSRSRKRK